MEPEGFVPRVVVEHRSDAPVVGEVRASITPQLDARNGCRLPSLAADAGQIGQFWLAAASCTGLSHLRGGKTGQDSFAFSLSDDEGGLIVAVADGVGSRPATAQLGSTLLARTLCVALASLDSGEVLDDPEDHLSGALAAANAEIERIAGRFPGGLLASALSSTVAFAWIPNRPDPESAVLGRVGDCGGFVIDAAEFHAVGPAEDGALNVVAETLPATDPGARVRYERVPLGGAVALVLTTDGLAEDVFSSPGVRRWLHDRWSAPCSAMAMLDALRYRRRGSHDDRTALVVWPGALPFELLDPRLAPDGPR
jgi:serine/threonine protein phosphatase PrpC